MCSNDVMLINTVFKYQQNLLTRHNSVNSRFHHNRVFNSIQWIKRDIILKYIL